MKEDDKPPQEIEIKDFNELDWNTEFYKTLNNL